MPYHYVVTGGAGFIGSNYVSRLLSRGEQVTIYDNLSRRGAEANLEWLADQYGRDSFRLVVGDVRDDVQLTTATVNADVIVHLAGQVAVTTSVVNPREDFEINALGTINVLESARLSDRQPIVIYASTNKVYGGMEDVFVDEDDTRYRYRDFPLGISEAHPLDFHSPYGCSKGAGDQYVRDYQRIFGVRSVVFRQSCIYGTRQFGVEDQGWVAWFAIAAVLGRPITIYGNGKQVRDLLFIEDLLDAYDAAIERIHTAAGQVYNLGGGQANTISIWREFAPLLARLVGHEIAVEYSDWRPGDQRIYVSDTRKAARELGWQPKINVEDGVGRLLAWVAAHRHYFS